MRRIVLFSVYGVIFATPGVAFAQATGFSGAPSTAEALVAITSDYFRARGGRVSAGLNPGGQQAYPIDVDIDRCDWRENRRLATRSGERVVLNGHQCIIKIYTAGWPAVQTQGFFHHDGMTWQYYGEIREPLIVPIDRFGQEFTSGYIDPKAGAIPYDGRVSVGRPFDPYDAIRRGDR